MSINTSVSSKSSGVFKTFPEFSKLTLGDRKKYEKLVADYPPVESMSFSSLMTWWDALDACRISQLHDNLIISYWLPGIEKFSGLSIIGTTNIDETICEVFDSLKGKGERARLVNVPEFVINSIEHPELFTFKPAAYLDEYIMPVATLTPLQHAPTFKRLRIKRFLKHTTDEAIVIKSLDLYYEENRRTLLNAITAWPQEGKGNSFSKFSDENMRKAINHPEALGIENLCMFVDGELQACIIYTKPKDQRYIIVLHARVNSVIPYTFDYAIFAFCGWLAGQGVMFLNLSCDLGISKLRVMKLSLSPNAYFRKYTIEPAT